MKLLLFDHNLSPKLIRKLADIYPNATHVSLLGLDTASDKEIWEYARANEYIIVTKDADFGEFRNEIFLTCAFVSTTQAVDEIQMNKLFKSHSLA